MYFCVSATGAAVEAGADTGAETAIGAGAEAAFELLLRICYLYTPNLTGL